MAESQAKQASVMSHLVRWSLAAAMLSGTFAALTFLLLVLPFTVQQWDEAGAPLPETTRTLTEHRFALAAAVIGLALAAVVAAAVIRSAALRTAILLLAILLTFAVVAAGIIGWWLTLKQMYESAGAV